MVREISRMTSRTPEDVARLRAAYERHNEAILAYALRRTSSPEDAEEVVSATFATAWRRVDRLPPEPFTRTWLYRVAWKTRANQRRSDIRRRQLADRLARTDPIEESDRTEPDARVHEALARLHLKEREVLRLIAWEELSYTEAAQVLGCSPNAFALRLHRARASLRRELEQDNEDTEDRHSAHREGCAGERGSRR